MIQRSPRQLWLIGNPVSRWSYVNM